MDNDDWTSAISSDRTTSVIVPKDPAPCGSQVTVFDRTGSPTTGTDYGNAGINVGNETVFRVP
jgi:hypothetical protein